MHQTSYPQQKPINPINPPAPYQGGKRLLSKTLIERIQKINHACYAEPFFGMGGVFFRRPFQAEAEVINDVSKDVTTFLKVLQRHFIEFVNFMRWHVTTRTEFERLKNTEPETLTDIERAARFFYLQKLSSIWPDIRLFAERKRQIRHHQNRSQSRRAPRTTCGRPD